MKKPLLMHIPVPWVYVLAYLCGAAVQRFVPVPVSPSTRHSVNMIGWVLMAVGVALAAWALTLFFRARTTTVPGNRSSALVTRGPYGFSRNPMYIALTLAYLGEAGILGQVWPLLFLVLTLVYVNFQLIPLEERHLAETFGETYLRYRMQVRRWL